MSSFGLLQGAQNVKQGIIGLLSTVPENGQAPLIVYYLAEIERQNGLVPRTLPVPPGADSYYGGIDFQSWDEAFLPSIIIACQPQGDPQRHDAGSYGQWFEARVAAVVQADTEDDAEAYAAHYGTAIAAAITRYPNLGGAAVRTELVGAPQTQFLEDPATRVFARSVTAFSSYVQPIVTDTLGPPAWDFDPYGTPIELPTVSQVNFTLNAEPLSDALGAVESETVVVDG